MENIEKQESGRTSMLKFFAIIAVVIALLIVLKMIIG